MGCFADNKIDRLAGKDHLASEMVNKLVRILAGENVPTAVKRKILVRKTVLFLHVRINKQLRSMMWSQRLVARLVILFDHPNLNLKEAEVS